MGFDPRQGREVRKLLVDIGLEYLERNSSDPAPTQSRRITVENSFYTIMKSLNLPMEDESLKDTPTRVAKMFCDEIFYGLSYENWPACSTFASKSDSMVAVRDIEVKSMCEHHFLPFIGTATVGYIPHGKVIGISKLNRIVDFFSRRPQMQERLTAQIAQAVSFVLGTKDVGVYMRAHHHCTHMRGVKDFTSSTVTSELLGRFRTVPELRSEFLTLTGNK